MSLALRPPVVFETHDDLSRISRDNPGYRFERERDGFWPLSPDVVIEVNS